MSFLPAVDLSMTTSFAPRPVAVDERERVEPRLGRVDARSPRCGAPPKLITLPFLPIRLRRVGDAADRRLDLGQRLHLRQERLVERRQVRGRRRG